MLDCTYRQSTWRPIDGRQNNSELLVFGRGSGSDELLASCRPSFDRFRFVIPSGTRNGSGKAVNAGVVRRQLAQRRRARRQVEALRHRRTRVLRFRRRGWHFGPPGAPRKNLVEQVLLSPPRVDTRAECVFPDDLLHGYSVLGKIKVNEYSPSALWDCEAARGGPYSTDSPDVPITAHV